MKHDKCDKAFIFDYNEYLDCFILFIKKQTLYKKFYQINFIINNELFLDKSFPIVRKNDIFTSSAYNILDVLTLKRKGYISNIKESDEYENLRPKRKNTFPFLFSPTSFAFVKQNSNEFSSLTKDSLRGSVDL